MTLQPQPTFLIPIITPSSNKMLQPLTTFPGEGLRGEKKNRTMKRHTTLQDLLGGAPKRRRVGLGRAVPQQKEEEKSVEQESEDEGVEAGQKNYFVKVCGPPSLTHFPRTKIRRQSVCTATL
jgi:hypothetical protein